MLLQKLCRGYAAASALSVRRPLVIGTTTMATNTRIECVYHDNAYLLMQG